MTKTHAKEDVEFASVSGGGDGANGGTHHKKHPANHPPAHHHDDGTVSGFTREALLEAYKSKHKELKESKKTREKQVIIENMRRRPPQLHLKPVDHRRTSHSHHNLGSDSLKETTKEKNGGESHKANRFVPRFSVLIPQQFKRPHGEERPEGWAAARISKAMNRYFALQKLTSTNAHSQYLTTQCKKLYDECCKCSPLAHGPVISESGVYQLAGPNLPRILRMLRSKKNFGMDLLQQHGVAKYTVTHVAAQRGYVDLTRELLLHWTQHPMESPNQPYSIKLLRRLLALVLQLRDMKTLVSESNSELRDVIARIGVSFAHFSDALDKLHDRTPSLEDLLVICGHPLVLCKDAAGNTPLHYAAEGGYLSLCQLLIEKGANINEQNKSGETPLHFAISSMHESVCTYLVQNKADVSLCRYVSLTLLNDVSLPGTFVDVPDSTAMCKVMPVIQTRSVTPKAPFIIDRQASKWVSPWRSSRRRVADIPGADSKADATVSPHAPVSDAPGGVADPNRGSLPHSPFLVSGSLVEDGMFTRVDSLSSSPLFRKRNPRDVVFFRTAPGNALIKPNILCVLLIGDHVSQSEVTKSREIQQRGKLFHLLIENLPQVAVVAMDSFRTPLFRCSRLKGVREYKQRWIVDNKIRSPKERRLALLVAMKGQKKKKKRRRLAPVVQFFWKVIKMVWKTARSLRRLLSIQNVFSPGESSGQHKESIICEPKGIVYEYVYDDAEFRGGASPTLSLIVETECKELIDHPWFHQLMDHKWNSFARDAFRRDFHIYFVYFISVFIATYLHVGDTLVGMPVGGYRSRSFTYHATWAEYVRDTSRLIYSCINAYYTVQEFRSYLERGSLRAYFQDGWNWFDLVQIMCVWLLLATELRGMISESEILSDDYELRVFVETYYSWTMWRTYNLRTTLMSIVGPQIFIKWIQFARGNRTLGPFVRMIFKMFKDIGLFLVVFCVFLFGFAFAFFILQLEGTKTYFSAITMVLQISLGAWDWDSIYEGGPIAIILFIIYAIIGTIMLLNLLIAMLGNTYDKIWEDRLLFFELERAKATLSIQNAINDDEYDEHYWCQRLFVMEGDTPIEGIQSQKF